MEYMLWAGTQESYDNYANLQRFLTDPQFIADSKMKAFYFDQDSDEYEDDEPSLESIGSHLIAVDDGVATVTVSGSLINSYSPWNRYFGTVSYPEIKAAVHQVLNDERIKSVIMDYDTGGGMVSGLDETAQFLLQAKKVKPFIAYTSTAALSGGYWLASTSSSLYAAKTAQVGSIGVILVQKSFHRQFAEEGVDVNVIRAGKNKALGNPYEPLSKQGREKLQADVSKIYGFFTEHVSQMRGVSINGASTWAEGNVFYAEDAELHKLVDGVTYFDFLVQKMRKKVNNSLLSDEGLDMEVESMTKKTVKTEKDLAKLQSGVPQAEIETVEDDTVEDVVEDTQANETVTETPPVETNQDSLAEDHNEKSVSATMLSETQDRLMKVNAKLAVTEASLSEFKSKFEKQALDTDLLIEAVATATTRLQISLNQSPTNFAGLPASSVIEQWTKTNEDFNKTFKIGAQAKTVKEAADAKKLATQTSIRPVDEY